MTPISTSRAVRRLAALVAGSLLALASPAAASVRLNRVSSDPFTNSASQHATEVEPDTFANAATVVSAFQVGRFFDGGSSDIGFARSTDRGVTYAAGFLPASRSAPASAGRRMPASSASVIRAWRSTPGTVSG